MITPDISGKFALCSTIISGLALVTSYSFAQQRRFPNVVLVWVCGTDFLSSLYMTFLAYPGPVSKELGKHVFDHSFCVVNIYVQLALDMHTVMTGLVMVYTLYTSIIQKIDFITLNQYYYRYLAAIWCTSLFYPLISLAVTTSQKFVYGVCALSLRSTLLIWTGPYFLLCFVQIALMIPVLHYVYKVKKATKGQVSLAAHDRTLVWLSCKYCGIVISQVAIKIILAGFHIRITLGYELSDSVFNFRALYPLFFSINSIIMMMGNRNLHNTIIRFYQLAKKKVEKKNSDFIQSSSESYCVDSTIELDIIHTN